LSRQPDWPALPDGQASADFGWGIVSKKISST
jgi:hypothetical protein